MKSILDKLIEHNKRLSNLLTLNPEILNKNPDLVSKCDYYGAAIDSCTEKLTIMEKKRKKCTKFEMRYYNYLRWVTEIDLEVTSICHLMNVSRKRLSKKPFQKSFSPNSLEFSKFCLRSRPNLLVLIFLLLKTFHLKNFNNFLTRKSDEKSFRLTEIKLDVDDRAVELDELEKIAAEILEFLDSETEREEIRNQIKTIMKMSQTIFATVAKHTREVTF